MNYNVEVLNGLYVERYPNVYGEAMAYRLFTPNNQVIAEFVFPKDGVGVSDGEALNTITKAFAKRFGIKGTAKKS